MVRWSRTVGNSPTTVEQVDQPTTGRQMPTEENNLTEAGTTKVPVAPTDDPTPVAKYDQNNPPTGWSYVNYKNQPGGGFSCPGCGGVLDGADVDGHRC
jgi:hypothetical protein